MFPISPCIPYQSAYRTSQFGTDVSSLTLHHTPGSTVLMFPIFTLTLQHVPVNLHPALHFQHSQLALKNSLFKKHLLQLSYLEIIIVCSYPTAHARPLIFRNHLSGTLSVLWTLQSPSSMHQCFRSCPAGAKVSSCQITAHYELRLRKGLRYSQCCQFTNLSTLRKTPISLVQAFTTTHRAAHLPHRPLSARCPHPISTHTLIKK